MMLFTKLRTKPIILALLLGLTAITWLPVLGAKEAPTIIAPAVVDNAKATGPMQTAVIAGGCFWGVQGVFEHVKGVRKVVSGYSGGEKSTAQYETVSSGTTGHAESVQITYNPAEVSYGELLQIFFSVVHDPTLLNRQGPDKGTQYRSAIFYTDATQKKIAEAYVQQLNKAHAFANGIVTKIEALKAFYPAEDYHQDFMVRNPYHSYIIYNDAPKLENFKRIFPEKYATQPVLVNAEK